MLIHLHPTRKNTKEYRKEIVLNTNFMVNIHSVDVVVNGAFTGSANGWNLGAGWAYAANRIVGTNAVTDAKQNCLSVGRYYRITYTVNITAGSIRVKAGDTVGEGRHVTGTYTEVLKCTGSKALTFDPIPLFLGNIDNVSAEVTDFEYLSEPANRRGRVDWYSVVETDNYIVAIANQNPVTEYVNVPVYYEFDPTQDTIPTDFLVNEIVSCERAPKPYNDSLGHRSVLKVNHKGMDVVEYLIDMHFLDILGIAHTGSTSTTTTTSYSTTSTSSTSTCTTYSTSTSTSSTYTTSSSSTSTSSTSTSSTSTTSTSSTYTTSTSTTSSTTPGYRP